ncbi:MAG: RNA polymerase sigma factor [Candidatus Binatia bacterium]|nr:MAG: RNA polymerase sigma factor [Candidatus Binatia bacterium]
MTDETLVSLARQELPYRTEAFSELVRRYEPRVFRTCKRVLGDEEEARDAAQEVFLRVFRGLRGFEAKARFRTWLFRIVANVCSDRLSRRAPEEPYGDDPPELPSDPPGTPEHGEVFRAFSLLSPEDRTILSLRFVSELSLEEIAGSLEISLSAAKMRLYRALERFRERYRELEAKNPRQV